MGLQSTVSYSQNSLNSYVVLCVVKFRLYWANKWLALDENKHHYNNSGFAAVCGWAVKAFWSCLIKGQHLNMNNAITWPLIAWFWWNFVCRIILEPHWHWQTLSKVAKSEDQKAARLKGPKAKILSNGFWWPYTALQRAFTIFFHHQFINFRSKNYNCRRVCV